MLHALRSPKAQVEEHIDLPDLSREDVTFPLARDLWSEGAEAVS